ncbi:hypothetical protein BC834DRAFT_129548 [Gloeopeniophorella convolvens]|nr:hypothetical protein BC834DRAFT_129548 [Gloeopeniophorella convolvens]
MRGTLSIRSRNPLPEQPRAQSSSPLQTPTQPASVPTIRLISATPSAIGAVSEFGNPFANNSSASSSFVSVSPPAPLAPKQDATAPKRRLVPKKSKLGLLVSGKSTKAQDRSDLSDVVRRVGGGAATSSVGRGGFEIYVDPDAQPDAGEVLMVKKKKSRAALSGLKWGTLGEVTNIAQGKSSSQPPKVKNDGKEKWWSISRGRKVSKDKRSSDKENGRTKSPEPSTESSTSRARFNSLDSGLLLNKVTERPAPARSASASKSPLEVPDLFHDDLDSTALSDPDPDEVHTPPLLVAPNLATGSIAVRAMRSMRSMARLPTWTGAKSTETAPPVPCVKRDKMPNETMKAKKKSLGRDQTVKRHSGESFEAGTSIGPDAVSSEAPTTRKHGVMGLGLPSSLRFGTVRSSSAGSSGRLSTSSFKGLAHNRGRSTSGASTASSLRPRSTTSRVSSSGSSSVKWDEERLETVKEARRQERIPAPYDGTRHDSTGKRPRNVLADLFSGHSSQPTLLKPAFKAPEPAVNLKEASVDRQPSLGGAPAATPYKQARVRPASDQMVGADRPRAMRGDPEGVLSILDAATNDLASLISRLDLEATPGTPGSTLRLSPSFTKLLAESPRTKGSPVKKSWSNTLTMQPSLASLASIQPYSHSRNQGTNPSSLRHGRQIAPWPVSPPRVAEASSVPVPSTSAAPCASSSVQSNAPTSVEEPDVPFVFRPLRPPITEKPSLVALSQEFGLLPTSATGLRAQPLSAPAGSNSRQTSTVFTAESQKELTLTKKFRKMMSSFSLRPKDSAASLRSDNTCVPLSREVRKDLGLAGTLGGSMSSRNLDQSIIADDPNSDIPDELQVLLYEGDAEHSDETDETFSCYPACFTRLPPSPGLPPESPLPTPTASQTSLLLPNEPALSARFIDEDNVDDMDESDSSSLDEDDTKKSFDFTGELKRLSESAGTHRHSFVEQLENAFRTPAKYGLDGFGDLSADEGVPPVPPLPSLASTSSLSDESYEGDTSTAGPSRLPALLPSPEILPPRRLNGAASVSSFDLGGEAEPQMSSTSKPSYGQLNVNFKFGGLPSSARSTSKSQLTLSDIIPSPAHARSISMASSLRDENASTESIRDEVAPARSPSVRRRVNSDASSRHSMNEQSRPDASFSSTHSRASSEISFKGFESFDEVRRGFEFDSNRPAFYPPPAFNNRRNQTIRDSMLSIASVSSYGAVLNPGVKDPFGYGYQSRPTSAEMSPSMMTMSSAMEDTFSFVRHNPRRNRVDSDASSLYLHAPGPAHNARPLRGHFRQDSIMSTNSLAPPVSIYNRSFGAHRRIGSASSSGSAAAGFMAGSRSSWAPGHRRQMSNDSVMSDMSMRMSRPNLGDKMLDSRQDYCVPLTSIAASPPGSVFSDKEYRDIRRQGPMDSIFDEDRRRYSVDSIIDKDQNRMSTATDSLFGCDDSYASFTLPDEFQAEDTRPFSLFSTDDEYSAPKRDDDTMISMIGGGHVRRLSVDSYVDGSPIFSRVGKRKLLPVRRPHSRMMASDKGLFDSPEVPQTTNRDSIVSTTSETFGEERMMSAQHGLFSRASLEEHCLSADGVDTSFMAKPVFSRPMPASRSRSGTQSSISSGADTPPLSTSGEASSVASESISSIDLSRLNASLMNMSHPMIMQPRARVRSRGHGHRRRMSNIRISRASVYETIEEEMSSANSTPVTDRFLDTKAPLSPVVDDSVVIVDADDETPFEWDDRGVAALRKYYVLKDEADVTIEESKQMWVDTPFSIYALQSFEPPAHRSAMRALLEHSRQTFGPLSAELRRIRSRTNSRPSPYPQPQRAIKVSLSSAAVRPEIPAPSIASAPAPRVLHQRVVNPNIAIDPSSLVSGKDTKVTFSLPAHSASGSRCNTVGLAKRGPKENKENTSIIGAMTAPGENLRLNRPRPRGRPAPRVAVSVMA